MERLGFRLSELVSDLDQYRQANSLMDYRSVVSQFRDQHAVCLLHGFLVGPVSLATTPFPLRKPRARHDLNPAGPHLRRASVCEQRRRFALAALPLDASLRSPLHFSRLRSQTEA
jgi:hypothetical protein